MVTAAEPKINKPPIKQLKYKTPEELEAAIDLYFVAHKKEITDLTPTTAGLAHFLGFSDRQSLYDYRDRSDTYSCVIKRAILFIESYHEASLSNQSVAGHIFWLKNHGWKDTQELTGANGAALSGPIVVNVISPHAGELTNQILNGIRTLPQGAETPTLAEHTATEGMGQE
jgi:hypothetical protein